MTSASSHRGYSAARTGSLGGTIVGRWAAIAVALTTLGVASTGSALVITGGPVYSLPGGGSCSVSGITTQGTGATLTCTGIVLTGHSNVYLGIRNDVNVNGNVMTGSLAASSAAVFRSSSTTSSSITYTSTTTVASNIAAFGTDPVTNTLTLTRTAGTGSPVSTGGTPANNGNGDIGHLFRITAAGTFTLNVDLDAASPHFSGQACTAVYDPSHAASAPNGDISRVDIAFYYSDCGDGVTDSPEQCDLGGANGSPTSCCSSTCTFTTNVCRASGGVCDPQETCTGGSPTCPADAKSSAVCRVSGGVCDPAESCDGVTNNCPADAKSSSLCRASAGACDVADFCDGSNDDCPADAKSSAVCRAAASSCDIAEACDGVGNNCPADDVQPSGTLCRASGGVCDIQEVCDGVTGMCPTDTKSVALCRASAGVCDLADSCDGSNNDCPADAKSSAVCRAAGGACDLAESCDGVGDDCGSDVLQPSGTICNAGSGDACDPDEACDGSNVACPSDTVTPGGTVCRAGSGDVCDPDETCTGNADDPCPSDVVASGATVCRPGSGDSCDPDEFCPGVPAGTCAADVVAPPTTVCNPGSGDACDPDSLCPGIPTGTCAADIIAPSGTACRSAGGVCDLTESCSGVADQPCPSDDQVPSGTTCRASTGFCDIVEVCDGINDACPSDAGLPDNTPCSDGLYCNGDETCQSNVCADAPNPCTFVCDEVTDSCDADACPDTPTLGCKTAQKAKLIIKDKTDDSKDKLIWKFIKGQNTTFPELQDPESTANITLCIYAGTAPAIINVAPSAAKWTIIGNNKGYKYLDVTGASDGVQKVIMKASDSAKTKMLLKGKGVNLPDILGPGPVTGLTTPVTAQLLNHDSGACWTSTFSTAIKNTPALFKAKQP